MAPSQLIDLVDRLALERERGGAKVELSRSELLSYARALGHAIDAHLLHRMLRDPRFARRLKERNRAAFHFDEPTVSVRPPESFAGGSTRDAALDAAEKIAAGKPPFQGRVFVLISDVTALLRDWRIGVSRARVNQALHERPFEKSLNAARRILGEPEITLVRKIPYEAQVHWAADAAERIAERTGETRVTADALERYLGDTEREIAPARAKRIARSSELRREIERRNATRRGNHLPPLEVVEAERPSPRQEEVLAVMEEIADRKGNGKVSRTETMEALSARARPILYPDLYQVLQRLKSTGRLERANARRALEGKPPIVDALGIRRKRTAPKTEALLAAFARVGQRNGNGKATYAELQAEFHKAGWKSDRKALVSMVHSRRFLEKLESVNRDRRAAKKPALRIVPEKAARAGERILTLRSSVIPFPAHVPSVEFPETARLRDIAREVKGLGREARAAAAAAGAGTFAWGSYGAHFLEWLRTQDPRELRKLKVGHVLDELATTYVPLEAGGLAGRALYGGVWNRLERQALAAGIPEEALPGAGVKAGGARVVALWCAISAVRLLEGRGLDWRTQPQEIANILAGTAVVHGSLRMTRRLFLALRGLAAGWERQSLLRASWLELAIAAPLDFWIIPALGTLEGRVWEQWTKGGLERQLAEAVAGLDRLLFGTDPGLLELGRLVDAIGEVERAFVGYYAFRLHHSPVAQEKALLAEEEAGVKRELNLLLDLKRDYESAALQGGLVGGRLPRGLLSFGEEEIARMIRSSMETLGTLRAESAAKQESLERAALSRREIAEGFEIPLPAAATLSPQGGESLADSARNPRAGQPYCAPSCHANSWTETLRAALRREISADPGKMVSELTKLFAARLAAFDRQHPLPAAGP